jgi:hypothetical protein
VVRNCPLIIKITGASPAGVWEVDTDTPGQFTVTSTATESTDITFDFFLVR